MLGCLCMLFGVSLYIMHALELDPEPIADGPRKPHIATKERFMRKSGTDEDNVHGITRRFLGQGSCCMAALPR